MAEHRGTTDKRHQIALSSSIEQVQWSQLRAAPGGIVGLEIATRFVGNGATLQIQLTDHQGTTHNTLKGQIHNNHLSAEIRVPSRAKKALFANVNFPKHGLKQKSPALVLTAPVEIKNPKWSKDEARRGDVLTLSADVEGVSDGTEATLEIFEHDADGAHDPVTQFSTLVEQQKVEAEWAYEYHEDTDDIPNEEEAEKGYRPPEYFFRVEVEGVAAKSDLLTFKDWIEFAVRDGQGQPREDVESVTLRYPDEKEEKMEPNEEGKIVLDDVPPGPFQVRDYKLKS